MVQAWKKVCQKIINRCNNQFKLYIRTYFPKSIFKNFEDGRWKGSLNIQLENNTSILLLFTKMYLLLILFSIKLYARIDIFKKKENGNIKFILNIIDFKLVKFANFQYLRIKYLQPESVITHVIFPQF